LTLLAEGGFWLPDTIKVTNRRLHSLTGAGTEGQ
jgi:hypothetical protein